VSKQTDFIDVLDGYKAGDLSKAEAMGEFRIIGVVIKMERDLPELVYVSEKNKEYELECARHAQMDMLQVGYVLVEPLIKEG